MRDSSRVSAVGSPTDQVRSSAKAIALHSPSDVRINIQACHSAAAFLAATNSTKHRNPSTIASSWLGANGLHPTIPDTAALSWIFVIDTLNFCFWGQHGVPRWSVCFNEKTYEGYWALCASINRALQEGIPITDPSFYANVSHKKLEYVFRSCNNTQIPLLESRVKVLNEAGTVLIKSFNSSVEEFVASAKGSADKLITLLVHNFSSFRDSVPSTRYNEPVASASQLCFYKRAQIFTADIWACFAATDKHSFHDIGKLTMFADYRVPQALVWLGAIDYSPELLETLTSGEELPHGDPREIQIRGCSIQAVEIIRREIERIAKPKRDESAIINSIVIDFALWDYATEHDEQLAKIPIHRTKSVYY